MGLRKLADAGCKVFVGHHQVCDVLFVPVGWLVLEQPCKGSLVYGIRKTYIACSDKVVANFSAAMGALTVDAKGANNPHMEAAGEARGRGVRGAEEFE